MTIAPGTRLGPYELSEMLGSGGMGEVYKARDPRIGRDVAVKVLPAAFAASADRLHRFEQEARAVGALNHPNLVTLFDLGQHDGAPYIVMELLEGESLRERLGPARSLSPGSTSSRISVRKAVDYAAQIANGLAAAHERGIIHRDLKPENVFITKDGRVKILDFGLAKLTQVPEVVMTDAPTQQRDTAPGTVMGTAGYMSPEQVRGHDVDHRADIFALGAILYEMLSGRRAFYGNSAADTMSAILREDPPDLSQSIPNLPPALERIVRHCLEKNSEERFQSARDLVFDLQSLSQSDSTVAQVARGARKRLPIGLAVAVAVLAFLAGLAVHRWGVPRAEPDVARIRYITFSGYDGSPAAAPDGKMIAFASERDGRRRIWLKQVASGDEIALTEGHDDFPRFSPDGSSVLFTRIDAFDQSLYKVPVVGGEARKVISPASDGDWSPDGRFIAFTRLLTGERSETQLLIANVDGSSPRVLLESRNLGLGAPRFSPDGTKIAVSQFSFIANQSAGIAIVDVASQKTQYVEIENGQPSSVIWLPSGEEIIFTRIESVTNVRTAPGTVVRHHIRKGTSRVLYSLPSAGRISDLLPGGRVVSDVPLWRSNLREVSLGGESASRWLTRGSCTDRQPSVSPDGEWIIFSSDRAGNLDLWALSRRTGAVRRITDDTADDWDPFYTHDGKEILWSSNRTGHFEIWIADADGSSARQLTNDGYDAENPTMSRDGVIVYSSANPQAAGLWRINRDGTQARRLVPGIVVHPEMSPDGKWVLYHQLTRADDETFAVRLSDGHVVSLGRGYIGKGGPPLIAIGRGRWAPDGKRFVFVGRDEQARVGVYIQDFDPTRDTTSTRRKLAGFDPEHLTESLGFTPDGKTLILSELEPLSVLSVAEGLTSLTR